MSNRYQTFLSFYMVVLSTLSAIIFYPHPLAIASMVFIVLLMLGVAFALGKGHSDGNN